METALRTRSSPLRSRDSVARRPPDGTKFRQRSREAPRLDPRTSATSRAAASARGEPSTPFLGSDAPPPLPSARGLAPSARPGLSTPPRGSSGGRSPRTHSSPAPGPGISIGLAVGGTPSGLGSGAGRPSSVAMSSIDRGASESFAARSSAATLRRSSSDEMRPLPSPTRLPGRPIESSRPGPRRPGEVRSARGTSLSTRRPLGEDGPRARPRPRRRRASPSPRWNRGRRSARRDRPSRDTRSPSPARRARSRRRSPAVRASSGLRNRGGCRRGGRRSRCKGWRGLRPATASPGSGPAHARRRRSAGSNGRRRVARARAARRSGRGAGAWPSRRGTR